MTNELQLLSFANQHVYEPLCTPPVITSGEWIYNCCGKRVPKTIKRTESCDRCFSIVLRKDSNDTSYYNKSISWTDEKIEGVRIPNKDPHGAKVTVGYCRNGKWEVDSYYKNSFTKEQLEVWWLLGWPVEYDMKNMWWSLQQDYDTANKINSILGNSFANENGSFLEQVDIDYLNKNNLVLKFIERTYLPLINHQKSVAFAVNEIIRRLNSGGAALCGFL